jgi:hypothetical protein
VEKIHGEDAGETSGKWGKLWRISGKTQRVFDDFRIFLWDKWRYWPFIVDFPVKNGDFP